MPAPSLQWANLVPTLYARDQLKEAENLAQEVLKLEVGILGQEIPNIVLVRRIVDEITAKRAAGVL